MPHLHEILNPLLCVPCQSCGKPNAVRLYHKDGSAHLLPQKCHTPGCSCYIDVSSLRPAAAEIIRSGIAQFA